jgi:hypothetical protein
VSQIVEIAALLQAAIWSGPAGATTENSPADAIPLDEHQEG